MTPTRRGGRRELTRAELIELFGAVPLFARLAPPQREAIAAAGVSLTAKRGETVVKQGEPGDAVYVVSRGSLLAHRMSRGGERRALNVIESPGSFGELALLDGRPRSVSVEALEECDLIKVSRADFLGLLSRDPRLVDGLLRELGRMIRRLTDQVADATLLDLPARVAKTLVRLVEPHSTEGSHDLVVSLSQGKLAELAGGSRQSVNGALATLTSRSLIRIEGRRILVTDLEGLRARAGVTVGGQDEDDAPGRG
ncbi:MAG: Crp/Fnr family transcriptional regulator [Frankiaceae bacterium]|nr:Crp/Fnr family transcriptional regulator [Frankiaceae bacterium]